MAAKNTLYFRCPSLSSEWYSASKFLSIVRERAGLSEDDFNLVEKNVRNACTRRRLGAAIGSFRFECAPESETLYDMPYGV